jgi:hypothetical protein
MVFTLMISQSPDGDYQGYIEEVPYIIRVKGPDMYQVRLDLYEQVREIIGEMPDPSEVQVQTKMQIWIKREER